MYLTFFSYTSTSSPPLNFTPGLINLKAPTTMPASQDVMSLLIFIPCTLHNTTTFTLHCSHHHHLHTTPSHRITPLSAPLPAHTLPLPLPSPATLPSSATLTPHWAYNIRPRGDIKINHLIQSTNIWITLWLLVSSMKRSLLSWDAVIFVWLCVCCFSFSYFFITCNDDCRHRTTSPLFLVL